MKQEIEKIISNVYMQLMEQLPELTDSEALEVRAEICRVINQCREQDYNYYGSWSQRDGDPSSICHRVCPMHSTDDVVVRWRQCIIEATLEKHESIKTKMDEPFKTRYVTLLTAHNWCEDSLAKALAYIDMMNDPTIRDGEIVDAEIALARSLAEYQDAASNWDEIKDQRLDLDGLYDENYQNDQEETDEVTQ